jgi:hypothetical protein
MNDKDLLVVSPMVHPDRGNLKYKLLHWEFLGTTFYASLYSENLAYFGTVTANFIS